MPGPWAKDNHEPSDHYTTKIGGLPDWPIPNMTIRPDLLECGACGSSLCLIAQVHAPVSSDISKIEERLIYVFGCVMEKCGSSPLSWRALRVQKYYSGEESSGTCQEVGSLSASSMSVLNPNNQMEDDLWRHGSREEVDDENNEDVDLEELGRALSAAACLASHSKKQNSNRHPKSVVKCSPIRPTTGVIDTNIPVVPCFYIYYQEEPSSRDITAVCSNYSSLSIKENQSDPDDHEEEGTWQEEHYEYDRALDVDRTYLKFKKQMDAYPEQCFRKDMIQEDSIDMETLSEYPLAIDMLPKDVVDPDRQPSLVAAMHHTCVPNCPKPVIVQKIQERLTRWGPNIGIWGDIQYLNGFWDWSIETYDKMWHKPETSHLARAVRAANDDYSRPNSMYRAFCEVWCPETNTFITGRGEIGISLWEMELISGLSIVGEYYEEIIPNFDELMGSGDVVGLPKACQYLFKAYALIALEKESGEVKYSDWVDFWYIKAKRLPNPRLTQEYKDSKRGFSIDKKGKSHPMKVRRPFPLRSALSKKQQQGEESPFIRLNFPIDMQTEDEAIVAAYLSLWLCRFVFPYSGSDMLRPGTFKAAVLMASGTTFSLVPPLLACLYRGLSNTYWGLKKEKEVGFSTSFFPLHYLYGWVGLHFPRGIFANIDTSVPYLSRVSGICNAYFYWEDKALDGRDILRTMQSRDFTWQLDDMIPPNSDGRMRVDDGKHSPTTHAFMISCRPGFVVFRHGEIYDVEIYSPHRFACQSGFRQRIPGTPIPLTSLVDATRCFSLWQSLTKVGSGSSFHLPTLVKVIARQSDRSYNAWWDETVVLGLDSIDSNLLKDSESIKYKYDAKLGVADRNAYRESLTIEELSRKRNHEQRSPKGVPENSNDQGLKIRFKIPKSASVIIPVNTNDPSNVTHKPRKIASSKMGKNLVVVADASPYVTPLLELDKTTNEGCRELSIETERMYTLGAGMVMPLDACITTEEAPINGRALRAIVGAAGKEDEEVSSHPSESIGDALKRNNISLSPLAPIEPTPSPMTVFQEQRMPTISQMSQHSCFPKSNASTLARDLLREALNTYLLAQVNEMLKTGFSQMRQWHVHQMPIISSSLKELFYVDPAPFSELVESFLKRVDKYLSKRESILSALPVKEKNRQSLLFEEKLRGHCQKLEATRGKHNDAVKRQGALLQKRADFLAEVRRIEKEHWKLSSEIVQLAADVRGASEILCSIEAERDKFDKVFVADETQVAACDDMRASLERDIWSLPRAY
ncbi:hypothetical protein HHK36_009380 [Tetracentron sinense]|uniref:Aminotransferase-like plant mobile domain-containing protein n=1 Tax=Tetracentron sinense TaxID=13715 RepID=A0A834ZCT5_TETSI|nr:hypothetical protein HHK36_009380 [Tetracentron sinense]